MTTSEVKSGPLFATASEQRVIRTTEPASGTRRWVFIDPPLAAPDHNREFTSAAAAAGYADDLAQVTGWPISTAPLVIDSPPCQLPFGDREGRINELLWLMTSIVPEHQLADAGPTFWAAAARQNAEIIVNAGEGLPDDDRSVLLMLGGAMLRQAAAASGYASVDDVLSEVMVLGAHPARSTGFPTRS